MSDGLHVIFGTGSVGCWIARALVARSAPVRAVNRTGRRPALMPDSVEMVAADLSHPARALAAARDAVTLYQALSPPFDQWHQLFPPLQAGALAAATSVGARYVSVENLYMYDSSEPIAEDSLVAPRSGKGELRDHMAREVMAAHQRGEVQAAALRASDFYGPGVLESALGKRVFGKLVAGRKAQILGSAHLPHSFAYIEDVGLAAATLGLREETLGQVWIAPHAPALTQGEMVEAACRVLGRTPGVVSISPRMMRLAGIFNSAARASMEMMYQFNEPFVVDSSRIEETFGLEPTPVELAMENTVAWYRAQAGKA